MTDSRPPRGARAIADVDDAVAGPGGRWALVRDVALARHRRRLGGRGTWGVEPGLRDVDGELTAEPCLTVFVQARRDASGAPLPAWVTVDVERAGRVAVRTQAIPVGRIELQATTHCPALDGARPGGCGGTWRQGARELALTAAHVVAGDAQAVTWSRALAPIGRGRVVTGSAWRLRRDPESRASGRLDACLVEVDEPGAFAEPGTHAWGRPVATRASLAAPLGVSICGPRRVTRARVAGWLPTGVPVTHAGVTVPFWRTIRLALPPGHETQPGDSGSPVIGDDGSLVGIHVGLRRTDERVEALCACAGDVLDAVADLMPGAWIPPG